ncbi:hypothetical protein AB9K21_01440 [Anaplasma phagocytophilum]|uniref:hypothetical protein n=1 Tax=Anaplasma phagocytophilum TaxID=948 RepID=UPI000AAB887D
MVGDVRDFESARSALRNGLKGMAERLIFHGVLVAPRMFSNVLRMVPPLIVSRQEIDEFLQIFEGFLCSFS